MPQSGSGAMNVNQRHFFDDKWHDQPLAGQGKTSEFHSESPDKTVKLL
jgi:hypothetical protein